MAVTEDSLYAVCDLDEQCLVSIDGGVGAAGLKDSIVVDSRLSMAVRRLEELQKKNSHRLGIAKVTIQVIGHV